MRDTGYLYLLAVTDGAHIIDEGLRHPFCTGFETSADGKLGWLRIGGDIGRVVIPKGTAVRIPSVLGGRIARGPDWESIDAEQFYHRGDELPDAYDLQDEAEVCVKLLAEAIQPPDGEYTMMQLVQAVVAELERMRKPGTPIAPDVPAEEAQGETPEEVAPDDTSVVCPHCEKVCASEAGRQAHIRAKHSDA